MESLKWGSTLYITLEMEKGMLDTNTIAVAGLLETSHPSIGKSLESLKILLLVLLHSSRNGSETITYVESLKWDFCIMQSFHEQSKLD